ncbi:MAG: hypothetical protein IPK13_27310 [Deltaproteobacteria bacterium]|nr:hypothetical protein [Deltaproteobacteria bacterium]
MTRLAFRFDGPSGGCQISLSKDDPIRTSDRVMLLAGHLPGVYTLNIHNESGRWVGGGSFEVRGTWNDENAGPSLWYSSRTTTGNPPSAAWGGGPGGPQNISVSPALGTRHVGLLFFDTSSQRFASLDPPEEMRIRNQWSERTHAGFRFPDDGRLQESMAHYYREVSHGQFDVSVETIGTVSLTNDWDTYFASKSDTDNRQEPKGSLFQKLITAADSLADFATYE